MNVTMKLALAKKKQLGETRFEEFQSARVTNPLKVSFEQKLNDLAEKII